MDTLSLHTMGRIGFVLVSLLTIGGTLTAAQWWPACYWAFLFIGPLCLLGVYDLLQTNRSILRNYPVLGHVRYLLEAIRPEIQQYFIEQNQEGRPLNREQRSIVYARAKRDRSTLPFGTQVDVYAEGYEWLNHSMSPQPKAKEEPRVVIGGPQCSHPYSASVLNISAMSFGSLSSNAVRALNAGAAKGNFFHNTGEGGVSPYHLEHGGDLCWQIGTGYFGCRSPDGRFDPVRYTATAQLPQVKLIELKLSQGAKPGKGGILPGNKVTEEIAEIRGIPVGEAALSPAWHSAFSTPTELMAFVQQLRELSGGKPVGIKLCLGKRREFFAVCKAMLETGITPDFISIDGGEGGTGAAPLEFSNSVGTPLIEGLVTVHNALVGFGLRSDVRIIASGGVQTAFSFAKRLALGADVCNAARSFMLALGCIQALRCNMNDCPTGVATQNPRLVGGLVVTNKGERVYYYHKETVKTLMGLVAAAGLEAPSQLKPWHIQRRVSQHEVHNYAELYRYLEPGELLSKPLPPDYERAVDAASAETFRRAAMSAPAVDA